MNIRKIVSDIDEQDGNNERTQKKFNVREPYLAFQSNLEGGSWNQKSIFIDVYYNNNNGKEAFTIKTDCCFFGKFIITRILLFISLCRE